MIEIKESIQISVRQLIEFVLRSGDIHSGFMGPSRMLQGTRGHQIIQQSTHEEYLFEVPISCRVERENVVLEVSGRIDRILEDDRGIIIDEIKTTTGRLESIEEDSNPLHWAQAKCYAYMYGIEKDLRNLGIQLTYFQVDSSEMKTFHKTFSLEELESFFYELVNRYLEWAEAIQSWLTVRNESIRETDFPFPSYRKGQREFAVAVYKTVRDGDRFFAQAPTGTGKTMAALFPAVKALGEGLTSKIFYLTAKTITRTVAEKAFEKMRERGLRFKVLTLTAKDKICFTPEGACNPEECEYARGHYDRVGKAIEDIFQVDSFNAQTVIEYARKHRVCPFEFSLDLSLWADCVICDYNYAFDPRVYLRRFFMDSSGDYCFLIDEAHNLVERAREMFSAELSKKPVLELKRATKAALPELSRILNQINAFFIKLRKQCEEGDKNWRVDPEPPKELYPLLRDFSQEAEEWLARNQHTDFKDDLLDFYFAAAAFLRTAETYDERYVTYWEKAGSDVRLKLFCLDPSYLLGEAVKRGKSAVFFSATLTPIDYFLHALGGDRESLQMRLPSPFPQENLCVLLQDRISTKYRMREMSYAQVTESIAHLIAGKVGNYLVYFPSYQYMNEVMMRFCQDHPYIEVIVQKGGMNEEEREDFLSQFGLENQETLVGFAVMGGIFGEGIDLVGDRLSGAVIVGVGLPQICLERNIIRSYFDKERGAGFEYAYIYPGINKVLQAVGRVIRTEEDRGVVLLIDERFSFSPYRDLLPSEWYPVQRVRDSASLQNTVKKFWR